MKKVILPRVLTGLAVTAGSWNYEHLEEFKDVLTVLRNSNSLLVDDGLKSLGQRW